MTLKSPIKICLKLDSKLKELKTLPEISPFNIFYITNQKSFLFLDNVSNLSLDLEILNLMFFRKFEKFSTIFYCTSI